MRRTLIILVILVVVAAGGFLLWRTLAQAQAPQTPKYETVQPTRTTLRSIVSATGSIEPEGQVSLAFKGAGRVAEVKVKTTDRVQVGQVLALLDSQDVALSVLQAEAGLASVQANLAQLTRKARPEDLEAARHRWTAGRPVSRAPRPICSAPAPATPSCRPAPQKMTRRWPRPTWSARRPPCNRRSLPTTR
ncbi:biotin/lipoyl-binding protein [Candidatus Amarolinea dominans]|uniref:biotin/lipoyl-binding protein n=1 Tax=Candidatus Amarolinea dominans TaxID=3140696 RepID=UPI0031CC4D49